MTIARPTARGVGDQTGVAAVVSNYNDVQADGMHPSSADNAERTLNA